jgi:hypothetical protein
MAIPIATYRQRSSNAFGRERDAQILWLLERHPATAEMLVGIGFFGSKARAAKRLKRLVEKKQVCIAGTVSLKDGRPQHIYCRCRWLKADNLLHEVQISRVCFRIHADAVRRGPGDVDRDLRPDAELVIGGRRYLLEFDHGTMSYQVVVQTRFEKYRACHDLVLWVCATQARMEGLRKLAEMIRETALFTTLDLALRDPHAVIWTDFDGLTAALPRAQQSGPKEWDIG